MFFCQETGMYASNNLVQNINHSGFVKQVFPLRQLSHPRTIYWMFNEVIGSIHFSAVPAIPAMLSVCDLALVLHGFSCLTHFKVCTINLLLGLFLSPGPSWPSRTDRTSGAEGKVNPCFCWTGFPVRKIGPPECFCFWAFRGIEGCLVCLDLMVNGWVCSFENS